MYLALYKGQGDFIDYLIRKRTKSVYSHVELVISNNKDDNMLCLSAKPFQGVRCDIIKYNKFDWDLVFIDNSKLKSQEEVLEFYQKTKGSSYDYLGVLNFINKKITEDQQKYFCSEWIGYALGVPEPSKKSPYDLFRYIEYANTL